MIQKNRRESLEERERLHEGRAESGKIKNKGQIITKYAQGEFKTADMK